MYHIVIGLKFPWTILQISTMSKSIFRGVQKRKGYIEKEKGANYIRRIETRCFKREQERNKQWRREKELPHAVGRYSSTSFTLGTGVPVTRYICTEETQFTHRQCKERVRENEREREKD